MAVGLHLVLKGVVPDTGSGVNNLLDEDGNLLGVVGEAEHKIAGNGGCLVSGKVLVVELGDLVHVAELADGSEEVVGRDGGLRLEESEPENLSVLG